MNKEVNVIENFITVLADNYSAFTHSQKIIANYLSDHLESVAFFTLEELAENVGTSTTTVIRFARMLGYLGYSDMQKAVQNVIKNKAALPERINHNNIPENELLQSCFSNDIENIRATLSAQNSQDLKKCTQLITDAKHLYILGMRSSFSVAYYTTTRLAEIRKNVHLIQSTGMLYPEEIASACNLDLCVAFLFPRFSKSTVSILSWLRGKGVKIILFTSMNYSSVKEYGDIILPCAISSINYKNSYTAPMCLINYLIAALVQNQPETSKEMLSRIESLLNSGFYLDF